MIETRTLSPLQKHVLKRFVNRTNELKKFRELLADNDRYVMCVTGEHDIGKTSFMHRMIQECLEAGWHSAVIACDRMANNDYRTIMRKIRSEIGSDHFGKFNAEDKERGQPVFNLSLSGNGVSVSVAEGATIKDTAQIGDIAGVKLDVEIPEEHLDEMERDRRSALTEAFIENLSKITENNRLVFFFDAIEKMSDDAERWAMNQLTAAALEGRIANVRFVYCGVRRPSIHQDFAWCVKETKLTPLGVSDVAEYLEKRGFDGGDLTELARQLVALTQGLAGRIANQVDSYEEKRAH